VSADDGLRGIIRAHLPRAHCVTIETGLTEPGVPDLNVCLRPEGADVWIECKATDGWKPAVRPPQAGWMLARWAAGGRCAFAVRRRAAAGPRRGAAVDELWLIAGCAARELKRAGLGELPLSSILLVERGGPSAWNWLAVRYALLHCRASG
jgi:hypothetical protein